jgi:hypothetical protein
MENRPELIFFGRLEERKGLVEFVEAVRRLALQDKCLVRIKFVGKVIPLFTDQDNGGNSEEFIKRRLGGIVEYNILGDLGSREAIEFVANSANAVVCLTSPSDNFPNAALEMGQIPVRLVVSNTTGFHQTLGLVGRTEGIYWFEPGCASSLVKAIGSALASDELRPRAPKPSEIRTLNSELKHQRFALIESAFAAKKERFESSPGKVDGAIILCPETVKARSIRRSLLALERSDERPGVTIVVVNDPAGAEFDKLRARFPSVRFTEKRLSSLQEVVQSMLVACHRDRAYAVVMVAGTALRTSAICNFSRAGSTGPELIASAEDVTGPRPESIAFQAPSVSMLVRQNNSCGSCLAASLSFLMSLPAVPINRPSLTLWLVMLAAAAQGRQVSYLPMPQHSVRSQTRGISPRTPSDQDLTSLWHYLAGLDMASWSRREVRLLILSVQQLCYGRTTYGPFTQGQPSRSQVSEVELLKCELEKVLNSYAWRITKPLRWLADSLRTLSSAK